MSESQGPTISVASSLFSLVLMLAASAWCFIAWKGSGTVAYLVASLGFLVLAPLWYRSPMSIKALFGPIGGRLTPRRRFSKVDILLTFGGYALVLFAISLMLFAWLQA